MLNFGKLFYAMRPDLPEKVYYNEFISCLKGIVYMEKFVPMDIPPTSSEPYPPAVWSALQRITRREAQVFVDYTIGAYRGLDGNKGLLLVGSDERGDNHQTMEFRVLGDKSFVLIFNDGRATYCSGDITEKGLRRMVLETPYLHLKTPYQDLEPCTEAAVVAVFPKL